MNKLTRNKNDINIIHVNIRSLNKNFHLIETSVLPLNYDFIILTECWLKNDSVPIPILNGFNYLKLCSNKLKSGGIVIYIKHGINANIIDPIFKDENCEMLCVQVPKLLLNIVAIYRHPSSNMDVFLKNLKSIFSHKNIQKSKNTTIFIGDTNIDLLQDTNISSKYIDLIAQFDFCQQIQNATRITSSTSTLIDHIITSKKVTSKCVFMTHKIPLTDHFPISISLSLDHYKENDLMNHNKIIKRRKFHIQKIMQFRESLMNIAWDPIISNVNVSQGYENFHKHIFSIYDKIFPEISITQRNKQQPKTDWITYDLIKQVAHKNFLYKKYIKNKNKVNEKKFKDFKKLLDHNLINAKTNYYKCLLLASNNSKDKWNILNTLMGKKKLSQKIEYITMSKVKIVSPTVIANEFNNHFGSTLCKESLNNMNDWKIHSQMLPNSMYVNETTAEEVTTCIRNLKNGSSHQESDLPIFIWKNVADIIAEPLSKIINKSFTTGIYPDELKICKIIPVYKKGDKDNIKNYRPISILPIMSKVFEKILLSRMLSFMNKLNIFPSSQYGFRKRHSTKEAILDALLSIDEKNNKRDKVAALLLDLSQAFDNVSHKKLLQKCYHFGIRGIAFSWLSSYLNNRSFSTDIGGKKSQIRFLKRGVPQGGILSPLLFIIYVADYETFITSKCIQYADDTTHILSNKSTQDLINDIVHTYNQAHKYFDSNELTLNADKTEIIFFRDNYQRAINIGNVHILSSLEVKLLGILIDSNLSMKAQINLIIKKINFLLPVIYNIRDYLTMEAKFIFYFSFINSHLLYCALFIQASNSSNLKALETCHRKVLKVLFNIPKYISSDIIYLNLNILSVPQLIKKEILLQAYKIYYEACPKNIILFFTKATSTRMLNFLLDHSIMKHSLTNSISINWNNLNDSIKCVKQFSFFKRLIYQYL